MANLIGSNDFLGFGINIFGTPTQSSALLPLVDTTSPSQEYMFPDPDIQGTYTIPTYASPGPCARPVPSNYLKLNLGSTRTETQSTLAESFGVTLGAAGFTGQFNIGYSQTETLTDEYFYCYYLQQVALGGICISETAIEANVAPDFTMAINNLPATFDPTNPTPWFDFFDTYGGYYVSDLIYGGTFQYYNSVTTVNGLSKNTINSSFQINADALSRGTFTESSTYTDYANNSKFQLFTVGGTTSINIDPTVPSSAAAQQAHQLIQTWGESTKMVPNTLIDIRVNPIWSLTNLLTPPKATNMRNAFADYTRRITPAIFIQTESLVQGAFKSAQHGEQTFIANNKPVITVNGVNVNALKPVVDPPRTPNPCFYNFDSGFQMVVIDSTDVTEASSVLWNKYYYIDLPSNELTPDQCKSDFFTQYYWITSGQVSMFAKRLYDSAFQDLVTNNLINPRNLLLFSTFGMPKGFVPSADFLATLLGAGAANYSKPLALREILTFQDWLYSDGKVGAGAYYNFGEFSLQFPVFPSNYILVGQFGSNPNAGCEVYVEDKVPNKFQLGYGIGVNLSMTLYKIFPSDTNPAIGFDSASIF